MMQITLTLHPNSSISPYLQVHDRDAIPVEPEFTLKNVPPEFQKPPFWYPPPPPVVESRPGSRKSTPIRKKAPTPPPPEEETVAPEPPPPEDDDDEGEVFGSAKVTPVYQFCVH